MRFSSFTYLVGQGLHNLIANRLMTFASMGVLTVCMLLIGTAGLFGVNVDAVIDHLGDQNEVVVFMQRGLPEEETTAADATIRAIPGVIGVTYVSPEEYLLTYDEMLKDYVDLYESFKDRNPLSAIYRVTVDGSEDLQATMSSVVSQLHGVPGVDSVSAMLEMADTFTTIQKVVTYGSYGLVAVLALVSMVVINNTIRITVFNRRKEIGIMKLVGATNGFIRFPFFVEGVTSGLIAAGVSSGIVCGAYYALTRWYAENPSSLSQMLGGTLVPLEEVWYYVVGGFVLFGFVLCGIGTATSIRKHLNV